MKHVLLATDATILTTTATAADAQGTTQGGVKRQETITPPFNREVPKVPDKALLAVKMLFRLAPPHRRTSIRTQS
jgi:hypothetical protein